MTLTLGFSPCPNDTFIFDALVNGKIDTGGLQFAPVLEDVQTLNKWAMEGRLDVSKISYGVLPAVLGNYTVLPSGGALGKGVGPLLISKSKPGNQPDFNEASVAIPGEQTTAHFLFSRAFPGAQHKFFMPFNEIEEAVLNGITDFGVIIHENRFTYQARGLFKQMDLGAYWEEQTGLPIPLGGIVMKREFGTSLQLRVNDLIQRSVAHAFSQYPALPPYVRIHAQEMDEAVMRQHIDLYVNQFSIDPGSTGRQAVKHLLKVMNYRHDSPSVFADEMAAS